MGIADSITGQILVNDNSIFKKDASGSYTGEMWLPCLPSEDRLKQQNKTVWNRLDGLILLQPSLRCIPYLFII